MVNRIGILTGGGDCPGLNSAIKAVTYRAIDAGYEVYGILRGWKGLLEVNGEEFGKHMSQIKKVYSMMPQRRDYKEYDLADIENSFYKNSNESLMRLNKLNTHSIDRTGGTILGSSRTNPYSTKDEKGETIDRSSVVIKNMKKLGIDGLVAIGGDDTLGVAAKLCDDGAPVVGIPKTIDKDLAGTDYTIGFSTAVGILHRSVNQLRTPAGSHKWIHIVEAMGRGAGHLALAGGTAADADMILIPEYDFKIDRVIELIHEQKRQGHDYHIIVVAEGAKPVGGTEVLHSEVKDEFGHARLSGISVLLEEMISNKTGMPCRHTVLGHLQRGGAPDWIDQMYACRLGISAMELIMDGKFGKMAAVDGCHIKAVPLEAVKKPNLVDVKKQYDTENYKAKNYALDMRLY